MKWKLWHNIIFFALLGCEPETSKPEPKEDLSIKEKKISIDPETWKMLEGQWREVKKGGEHWKVTLPCEGEGSSLIFSKKGAIHSFAQFQKEDLVHDIDLSSVEKKNEALVIQNDKVKIQAKFQEGILSIEDKYYSQIQGNIEIERVYADEATCAGEVSLKGLPSLLGDWYDAPCGSVILKISEKEFTYRGEQSEIAWLQPESEHYWLTLKKANKIYGAVLAPDGDVLQVRNGRYDNWKPINLHKRSKECVH